MKKILVLLTLILGFFAFSADGTLSGLPAVAQTGAPTMDRW